MRNSDTTRHSRARRGHWPLLGTAGLALLLAGCNTDSLLDVNDPDIVLGDIARDTANLPSVTNGVLFEFARALTGPAGSNNYPGVIGVGGVLSDEQWYSSTFTQMREIDARSINDTNGGVLAVFQYLQRSRNWSERAAEVYATSGSANTANHALVTNIAGYTHVYFAENFCSGVPLSETSFEGELEYGPRRTTQELLEAAIQRYDAAITIAQTAMANTQLSNAARAAAAQQLNLARVGKARALQDLGRFAEAAAVAQAVTPGFAYLVAYSENASGQNNGIWGQINSNRRSSVATQEGTVNRGLRYFNLATTNQTIDPRVPVTSLAGGLGTGIPVFRTGKYATRGADIPIASYVEAQLIVAENLLNKGQSNAYLTVLNKLRTDLPTLLPTLGFTPPAGGYAALPALTDPTDPKARVRQLYQERAFWLWLTGHRLGDLRRMVKYYGFAQDEVFPTGTTRTGRPYGDEVNLPVPFQEENNPQATGGCIDRNA